MARGNYHIRLNGVGYMLATDEHGSLMSGASRTNKSDPFMHHVTQGELVARQRFTFEQGAGATRFDGSGRYRRGYNIDTRGGNLILGPEVIVCQEAETLVRRVSSFTAEDDLEEISISTAGGDVDGYATRITVPAGKTQIKSIAVLVKRERTNDYAGAAAFTINLHAHTANRPGAIVAGATASPVLVEGPEHSWGWVGDPWLANRWVWIVGHFASAVTVTPGGTYWISIINTQGHPVIWAADESGSYFVSQYNGSTWTVQTQDGGPYYKANFYDEIDAPGVCFHEFRGGDNIQRLYAGVGRKVMYWDAPTEAWILSKGDFTEEVTDMALFENRLFVAQGPNYGVAHLDGISPTTTWTVMTNIQAQALALHDNLLWAAYGADVQASADGLDSGWGHNDVTVGDPGTLVTEMISHGGKLYAFKEEGVFEISYPDEYPETEEPTANMVHDFRTARSARAFAMDWHSGAYFPGAMGLYEWRGGVLRDIWAGRIEEDLAREVARPADHQQYIEAGIFQAAVGTTRGLWAALCSPHLRRSAVWYYHNQGWHPIYQQSAYEGEYIRGMWYESFGGGEGRLWFSLGHDIAYMEVPHWTDDRTLDDDATFATSGELELPVFDNGDPAEKKQFCGVGINCKNADANNYVTVQYQIDEPRAADTWTTLGAVNANPYTELAFTQVAAHVGYTIRLKLVLTGDAAKSIEVEEVHLLFQPLPDTITQHQVTIRLADHLETLDRVADGRRAGQVWEELADLLEEDLPWAYVDELGVSHTVRATGLSKGSLRTMDDVGAPTIEGVAHLQMLEVDCGCAAGPA